MLIRKLSIFRIILSYSVTIILVTSPHSLLSSIKHDATNEFMLSDVVMTSVMYNLQESNKELSVFVIVYVTRRFSIIR